MFYSLGTGPKIWAGAYWPSAATVTTTKLDIYHSKFRWRATNIYEFRTRLRHSKWGRSSRNRMALRVLICRYMKIDVCRWPVDSHHKGPVTRKMFPFDDIIMYRMLRLLRVSVRRVTHMCASELSNHWFRFDTNPLPEPMLDPEEQTLVK